MPRRVERYLPYVPLPNSEHVYVNGVEQRIGTDYTIENTSYVIVPSAAEVGDTVEVLYAHQSVAGAPAPAFVTNPDAAVGTGTCAGQALSWNGTDWNFTDWSFTSPAFDTPINGVDPIPYTLTVGYSGPSTTSWDVWAYFRKPDGCFSSFNFITGSINGSGFGPYSSDMGPWAQNYNPPWGSVLIGASLHLYTNNKRGRIYYERA